MNERILQLAASHFPRDGEGNISATPEMIIEFAELIVRECAFIVEDAVDHREPASTYVDKIKQHFGIE